MNFNFEHAEQNIADQIRNTVRDKLNYIADDIVSDVIDNLDLEDALEGAVEEYLEERLDRKLQNIELQISCNTCGEDVEVDSCEIDEDYARIALTKCTECQNTDEAFRKKLDDYSIVLNSKCDIEYVIDNVTVHAGEIHIDLDDAEMASIPGGTELYAVQVGDFVLRKLFANESAAVDALNSNAVQTAANILNCASNTQIVTFIVQERF